MKKLLFLFVSLLCAVTSTAQQIEGGEAFYIYQNDGHFDGFFYDEVQQMSYSKLDTLGREHDFYVTQEIVTADSTYRIMLTAIDSISFVQPEIRFSPKVRFMREEGMLEYYSPVMSKDMSLIFRAAMPADLQPKIGDVLACPDLELRDNAFVGKVTNIENIGGFLRVDCAYVEQYSDVFQQFVTVEQVVQQNTGDGTRTMRRIAGLKTPKKGEGNLNVNLFQASANLEANLYLAEKCKVGFGLSVGLAMSVKAVYNISWTNFYIKTQLNSTFELSPKFSFDGEMSHTFKPSSIPGLGALISRFSRIPFPANFPMLYIKVTPEPVVKVEGHFNLAFGMKAEAKCLSMAMEVMDKSPYLTFRANLENGAIPFPVEHQVTGEGFLTAELNGAVYPAMLFPIKMGSEDWMKYLAEFECGNDLYVGPKLTGAISYDLMKDNDNIYDTFKDAKINLSLITFDDEYGATFKAFKKKWELKETHSFSYGNMDFTLMPTISDGDMETIGNSEDGIHYTYNVEGDVFYPQKLGVGVFKKADDNDIYYKELYRSQLRDETYFMNTFNKIDLEITGLEAGEYRVRPIIRHGLLGMVPIYSQEKVLIVEPQELMLKPSEGTFEEQGGEAVVTLVSKLNTPITIDTDDKWITATVNEPAAGEKYRTMTVKVAENNTDALRTGAIRVRQRFDATTFVDRYYSVRQYGGLQLSVSKLDVEPAGDECDVEVMTSMRPVTINLQGADDWIGWYLEGNNLHLSIKENSGTNRTATIIVSAWSEKHQGINTAKLYVNQKGAIDASVSPADLTFEAAGGTQRVNVVLGPATTFNDVILSKADREWLIVEKQDAYFNITAMPNTNTEERKTTVDVSVTTTDADGKSVSSTLPVNIAQKFGATSVEPSELHFTADGGKLTAKMDVSTYPYCGIADISASGDGWCDATVAADGTVTVTATANAGSAQRECTVVCFVAGVKNPSAGQMIKLNIHVLQAGKELPTVSPDGDKSPFNFIAFTASRTIRYVSEKNGAVETMPAAAFFNFNPKNAHFTVTYGKDVNHYECQGYDESSTNKSKSHATLAFDVDNKNKKVKNVRFTLNGESTLSMHWPGIDINVLNILSTVVTVSELPLQTNGPSYKYGKLTAAEGLKFGNYSCLLDQRADYGLNELGHELYGDGADPYSDHIVYEPTNDGSDYAEIYISYKNGQGEPVVVDFPDDAVMKSLQNGGMPIYEGSAPPTLNGTYRLSAPSLVADKMGAADHLEGLSDIVIRFSSQQGGQLKVNSYITAEGEVFEDDGDMSAVIMGNGNSFTVCMPDGYGSALILSGQVSGGSIVDLHYASTSMDTPGKYIIIKDGTGSSSKTTWAPGSYARGLNRRFISDD